MTLTAQTTPDALVTTPTSTLTQKVGMFDKVKLANKQLIFDNQKKLHSKAQIRKIHNIFTYFSSKLIFLQ